MKTLFNTVIVILITLTSALAQPRRQMDRGHAMERIHAAKIAYVTDRLHLTEQQSSAFIPIYNQQEQEIRETRQTFFRKYKGAGTLEGDADDATYRKYIDDNLDYQQQVIEIKRKYNERFLKIISAQQLANLPAAEREFRQILMKQLQRGNGRFNRRNGMGF